MSDPSLVPSSDPPRAAGAIHDLGYKRYVGTRRPPSTRWRVIMRQQIATSWKTWWRFKAALGMSVIITVIAGGFIYAMHDRIFEMFSRGDIVRTFANSVLPYTFDFYFRAAFILSLTIGAGVVASDVQSGGFTFYFARSIRPRDYAAGKLGGLCIMFACVVVAGPLLLAALQLGMSRTTDELIGQLPVLAKTLAIGGLATLAFAAVPLAFSALVPNRRYALALWAAYYLILGSMAIGLGMVVWGPITALDLPSSFRVVTYHLFEVPLHFGRETNLSFVAALIGIGAHVVVAIAILLYRVRAAQRAGVGGSS